MMKPRPKWKDIKKREEKEKKVSGLSVLAIGFGLDGDGLFLIKWTWALGL